MTAQVLDRPCINLYGFAVQDLFAIFIIIQSQNNEVETKGLN